MLRFCTIGSGLVLLFAAGCNTISQAERAQPDVRQKFINQGDLAGRVTLVQFGRIGDAASADGLEKMLALKDGNLLPPLHYVRVEVSTDAEEARDYFAYKAPGLQVHLDAKAELARSCGVQTVPTFVLLDKFGHVRYRGPWEDEELYAWVAMLENQRVDPGPHEPLFNQQELPLARLMRLTTLPTLLGREPSLHDLCGKNGLLVIFVDTVCPFSEQASSELPVVAEVLKKYEVTAVVVNIEDNRARVQEFYSAMGLPLPVMYDESQTTTQRWNIESVPTVFLITTEGEMGYRGPALWEDLGRAAEGMLGLPTGSIQFPKQGTGFG